MRSRHFREIVLIAIICAIFGWMMHASGSVQAPPSAEGNAGATAEGAKPPSQCHGDEADGKHGRCHGGKPGFGGDRGCHGDEGFQGRCHGGQASGGDGQQCHRRHDGCHAFDGGKADMDRQLMGGPSIQNDVRRSARKLSRQAWSMCFNRDYSSALEFADRSIGFNPDSASTWHVRALALHGLQRDDEALESINHAEQLRGVTPQTQLHKTAIVSHLPIEISMPDRPDMH